MIRFNCPSCEKPISTNDAAVGGRGKCPNCGSSVTVPTAVSDDAVLAALVDFEPPKPTSGLATASLITGIMGICCCLGMLVALSPGTDSTASLRKQGNSAKDDPARVAREAVQRAEEQEQEKIRRESAPLLKDQEQEKIRRESADCLSKKIEAWSMAELFVEKHLKSPTTAKFGYFLRGEYQNPDECVRYYGNGIYIVAGWVDAQNSFGATVRNEFLVNIQDQGDKWVLVKEVILYPR